MQNNPHSPSTATVSSGQSTRIIQDEKTRGLNLSFLHAIQRTSNSKQLIERLHQCTFKTILNCSIYDFVATYGSSQSNWYIKHKKVKKTILEQLFTKLLKSQFNPNISFQKNSSAFSKLIFENIPSIKLFLNLISSPPLDQRRAQ